MKSGKHAPERQESTSSFWQISADSLIFVKKASRPARLTIPAAGGQGDRRGQKALSAGLGGPLWPSPTPTPPSPIAGRGRGRRAAFISPGIENGSRVPTRHDLPIAHGVALPVEPLFHRPFHGRGKVGQAAAGGQGDGRGQFGDEFLEKQCPPPLHRHSKPRR